MIPPLTETDFLIISYYLLLRFAKRFFVITANQLYRNNTAFMILNHEHFHKRYIVYSV